MHNRVIDMHAVHQPKPGSNFLVEVQDESCLLWFGKEKEGTNISLTG